MPEQGDGSRRRGRDGGRRQPRRRATVIGVVIVVLAAAAVGVYAGTRRSSHTVPAEGAASNAPPASGLSSTTVPAPAALTGSALIKAENARPGTTAWKITSDPGEGRRPITGWASRVSAQRGESVDLYVSTQAKQFHVDAYRLGYYGGDGGRLVWQSGALPGVAQPACTVTSDTKMVSCANWSKSLTVQIGQDWTPGEYLFELVTDAGGASYVPFTVRDDASHAAVEVILPVTTWQAYNAYDGHSLYGNENMNSRFRSDVVSFDRPYGIGWNGSAELFAGANEFITMGESMGLDVTYTTSVDEAEHPELLRNHRVIVSMAHDEYYSVAMRQGLEAARDAGVNLMFLGANAVFRRIRLQPSSIGPDREIVNYRAVAPDPVARQNPALATTSWREPPDPDPESSLIGELYECNPVNADLVVVNAGEWMFAGTGITNGEHFRGVIAQEYDRVNLNYPTPPDIEVLAHSPLTCRGHHTFSDMTYYTAPSGGGVFASGTIGFEPHLKPLCAPDQLRSDTDCQLSQMIANILEVFADGPAGKVHPSRGNLAGFGIHKGYVEAPPGE